ncbi:MAG TPA: DUF3105 domain-containing protein [Actinomycetota bacterium]|nr:DUF3105 domain-containing protein [Actinomycetota bacterium]
MSKKLLEKQRRRLEEEKRLAERRSAARRRNLITLVVAVVVSALVVGAIYMQRRAEEPSGPVGVAASQAGCGAIERPEEQGREHIEVGSPHEPYSSSPPTSGPHYETPASTGFYPSALEPEQVVHNLEHSQIVIWYRPDVSETTLDQLEAIVDQEPLATLAVPYEDIEGSASFVLTAWGASQSCARVSQEVIDDFRRQFQGQGPEKLVPPFDG